MSERIGYLDGWRGFAILCVLEAHFVGFFESFRFDFGRFGIDVFFSLSGMLMAGILFEQRMPLGLFYRRRISRILPVSVARYPLRDEPPASEGGRVLQPAKGTSKGSRRRRPAYHKRLRSPIDGADPVCG